MLDEQRLYEYGGLLAAGYGLYQARKIHDIELEKAKQRHKESIELARKQHETDMKTVKQTYLLELFNSLEQHFQQLNADLIASSRESERDMFDQRNQSFQTIILASSVMFSALSSIIVDGNLPRDSGQFLFVAYALTCALSFSFLFLSIVFCIELVIRTSSFMYKRGKSHTKSLRKAINDTKGMMRDLRGEGRSYENLAAVGDSNDAGTRPASGMFTKADDMGQNGKAGLSTSHSCSLNALNEGGPNNIRNIRRAISRMNPNEIEEEFERHEAEIRGYLKKREVLNDSAAITSYRDEVTGHKRPFKHFWEESCETWWSMAILLFYGGSLNMLLALMIYMWAQFFLHLQSLIAAIIGVSLLGLILVIGIATVIVMRHVDRQTNHQDNMELQSMFLSNMPDESLRVDLSGSTADLALSSSDRLSNRANSLNGSPRATSAAGPPPPPQTPMNSFLGRSARTAELDGAGAGGSGRSAGAPVGREHTDSTTTMTSSPSQSGGSSRGVGSSQRHPPPISARASGPGPARSSRTGPAARSTPNSEGLMMQNLPSRLDTHLEDIESGSMMTDNSVNSVLSLPPRFPPGENIFQEEPSPRRRYLSSFGRSASTSSQHKTPSLYATALRNSSGTPSQLLAAQSSQDTPQAAAPPNTPATSKEHSFRFPSTFSSSGNKKNSPGAGDNAGNQQYSTGARQNPIVESDSGSNLSNMSGSGGGITF